MNSTYCQNAFQNASFRNTQFLRQPCFQDGSVFWNRAAIGYYVVALKCVSLENFLVFFVAER